MSNTVGRITFAPWPLRYVCKYCGVAVAEFPNVRSHEPSTLSVCNAPACRARASREWKAAR